MKRRLARAAIGVACAAIGATLAALPAEKPSARHALPFIEDDYERALSEARTRKLPIFVESWTPW